MSSTCEHSPIAQRSSAGEDNELDLAVFDPPSFLDRCMGEREVAKTLLGMFEERLPKLISEVCEGFMRGSDCAKIVSTVHYLKGSRGDLSAMRLHHAASRLEESLRSESKTDAAHWLRLVQEESDRFLSALPEFRGTLA